MRTASRPIAGERITFGDPDIASVLATALLASGEVDRATHGFHTWPAGLHADAAQALVQAFPGSSVLDPFCGGGTVLIEAMIAGRRAVGRDLSTIAMRVARARTSLADDATLTRMRSLSRKLTEEARANQVPPPDPVVAALRDWYAPHALLELAHLRRGVFAAPDDIRPLLEAIFSSIVVKTSWRESDTSGARVKHDRPPGTAAILFHKKARELGRRIADLRARVPVGTPPVDLARGDARQVRISGPVELVLTSPPYPSTYDYLPLQHLRRVWFGETGEGDDAEIGARRQFRAGRRDAMKQWRADTRDWMRSSADALVPGGHLVVIIGDGYDPNGPIDASEPTEAAAKEAGLSSVGRASVERRPHPEGEARWEHGFAFRKGGA
jgi:DNA modification methylase